MKSIKLITLLLAMLTVAGVIAGCNDSVTTITLSGNTVITPQNLTTAITTTVTTDASVTTETIIMDALSSMDLENVSNIKRPWEYVADSTVKAQQEGWILLNDYFGWHDMEITNSDYHNNYFSSAYFTEDNRIGEIYAVELIFSSNQFYYWGHMSCHSRMFGLQGGTFDDTIGYVSTVMTAPYWKDAFSSASNYTHDFEFYEDADFQKPVTHLYAVLDEAMVVNYLADFDCEYRLLPSANELIEIRLWGKLVENEK